MLVHGSLDRGSSFTRVVRRLPGLRIITYDRRGYQGSRDAAAPGGLGVHIADLLEVAAAAGEGGDRVTAVGHSYGGDVVIGATIAEPGRFASIGAFEPPMPWLGFRRNVTGAGSPAKGPAAPGRGWSPLTEDPAIEAERFFARMVGESSWERLSESGRASRRADGPALVDDLMALRTAAPFDVRTLSVPAVFGRGGPASGAHHRDTVAWLVEHVPGATLFEVTGSGHGAHLSHPDAFAELVTVAVGLGRREPDARLEGALR